MPRYINKQRHLVSCGPIAAANAAKWAGMRASYTAMLKFSKAIDAYDPEEGMWPKDMSRILSHLKIPFRKSRTLTIEELDRVLSRGKAVVLIYKTRRGSHAAFVECHTVDSNFIVWNRRSAFPRCGREELNALLVRSRVYNGLHAYIISKPRKKQ